MVPRATSAMNSTSAATLERPLAERYQPLIAVAAAAALGMTADRYLPDEWRPAGETWLLLALILLVMWCLARVRASCQNVVLEITSSSVLLCVVAFVAAAWHHDRWYLFSAHDLGIAARDDTQPMVLEGVALTSPRFVPAPTFSPLRSIPKGDATEFLLRVTAVRNGQTWQPADGVASVDVEGHVLGMRAGDRLRVYALVTKPSAPLNPGEFDYRGYQRSRRILARLRCLFPEHVQSIEPGHWWNWRRWLALVRDQGNWQLHRFIDGPRGSLAAAILLGAREQLHPEQNETFLVTGTIHILSISGVHVGILAYGFFLLARAGLWRGRGVLVATGVFTILYALLTDAQPPVVRAAVLIVLMCTARWAGRRPVGFNTLSAAAIIVLAWHPGSLFFAGTQLSFLAVAVMITFRRWIVPPANHDPYDEMIAHARPWYDRCARFLAGETWRVFLTGSLIWAFSLPLVWLQYHLVSPIGLAINPVIWLPITVALFAGFGVVALGWIIPGAGAFCGGLCDGCLWFIERTLDVGVQVPGSYFWTPAPPWWWVALFYAGLIVGKLTPANLIPRRLLIPYACAWVAVAAVLSGNFFVRQTDLGNQALACTFVSVGHGTACLLELPNGRNVLYDAGRLGSPMAGSRPVSAVLWSRGISHLDAVIISHADADHYNALPELFSLFSVGEVHVSPVMFEHPIPAVLELQKKIEESKLPLRVLFAGDRLKADPDVKMEVLHPPRKGVIGSNNANSIVLLVEYAGRRLLLPGDLESPGLDDLLAEPELDCDVVMAPHHGSNRSNPSGFTAWCTPEHIVISGPRDSDDPQQAFEVRRALSSTGGTVYHTAEVGAVRFVINAEGIRVQTGPKSTLVE